MGPVITTAPAGPTVQRSEREQHADDNGARDDGPQASTGTSCRREGRLVDPGSLSTRALMPSPHLAPNDATIRRAKKFTKKVITKSTRPVAIKTFTWMPVASGKSSAMLAAIVAGFAGLIRFKVTPLRPKAPSPPPSSRRGLDRARASRAHDAGATETARRPIRIISQRVVPSAMAASSLESRRLQEDLAAERRHDRQTIMIARTTPTVSIVRPVAEAGPAKNGIQPKCASSQS